MQSIKMPFIIGILLISTSCSSEIRLTNPNQHFISDNWIQTDGPKTSRIGLNLIGKKYEIYLNCLENNGKALKSISPFPIKISVDQNKFQLNESVEIHTQGAAVECQTSLTSGTYEAHEVKGQKIHLIKSDDWTFIGVFQRSSKPQLGKDRATTNVQSRITRLP